MKRFFRWKRPNRSSPKADPMILKLYARLFSWDQIKSATDNFNPAYEIYKGGSSISVYQGILPGGKEIAVKLVLDSNSVSRNHTQEFMNEFATISTLHHPNLVELYGFCSEGDCLGLIYEHLENDTLARALFEEQLILDWPTRLDICIGIARGLAYIHEDSKVKIVHRDINASNVLLDKHFNPKICDLGLAFAYVNEVPDNQPVFGTLGYLAPEYIHGDLSTKSDVFSFGVVLLQIVSGKAAYQFQFEEEKTFFLYEWAQSLKHCGKVLELIDPKLGAAYNEDEVMNVVDVALLCTDMSPDVRPQMSSVVNRLEGIVSDQSMKAVSAKCNPK